MRLIPKTGLMAILLIGASGAVLHTQGLPSFEVASVKPNVSGSDAGSSGGHPGGYTAVNMSLRRLIGIAYGISPPLVRERIVGPSWIDSSRFDISARVPEGSPSAQVTDMLRALLEQRFKLVTHTETRQESVYALVRSRTDGPLGPELRRSSLDCSKQNAAAGGGGAVNTIGSALKGENPPCGIVSAVDANGGVMRGGNVTMDQLAKNLTGRVTRNVVDRTGLTGAYDFWLRWTPDNFSNVDANGGPSRDGTLILTALQEQLGLKLETHRGPVEFLIIDQVERPSPD